MLMHGRSTYIKYLNTDCIIYNLCSYAEGWNELGLIPPNSLGAFDEYDFDIKYMHYILDNDMLFMRFMQIVLSLYQGKDVYLIVSTNTDWINIVTESLLKLLQQRYGINSIFINDIDDIVYEELFSQDKLFDPRYGIQNFMIDKERYEYIMETNRIMTGGAVYNE